MKAKALIFYIALSFPLISYSSDWVKVNIDVMYRHCFTTDSSLSIYEKNIKLSLQNFSFLHKAIS